MKRFDKCDEEISKLDAVFFYKVFKIISKIVTSWHDINTKAP